MKPREWWIISKDTAGPVMAYPFKILSQTYHVREVLPAQPDTVTITREELRAAFEKAKEEHLDHGAFAMQLSCLEDVLFGSVLLGPASSTEATLPQEHTTICGKSPGGES